MFAVVLDWVRLLAPSALTFAIGWIVSARKSRTTREHDLAEKQDALREGMLAIMRSNIMDAYERYVLHGAPLTVARRECIDKEHEAYHLNGGNSTGDRMYQEICNVHTHIVGEKED